MPDRADILTGALDGVAGGYGRQKGNERNYDKAFHDLILFMSVTTAMVTWVA